MKYKKRSPEEMEALGKKVIKYYFGNPHGDIGMKEMSKKFNASETIIRKVISAELDRKFKNAQKARNR